MAEMADKTQLVAYCGLYCGGCGRYKKGKCKACKLGGGFSRCKVRICATDRGFQSCAECAEVIECKEFNSFISKVFAFIFRSDRKGSLAQIRDMGIEKWAEERDVSGLK